MTTKKPRKPKRPNPGHVAGYEWEYLQKPKEGTPAAKLGTPGDYVPHKRLMKVRVTQKGEQEWYPVLPFNVIPGGVLKDETGAIRAVGATVIFPDGRRSEIVFPDFLLGGGAGIVERTREFTGMNLRPKDRDNLFDFLNVIIHGDANGFPSEKHGISMATWDGDKLVVPGPNLVLPEAKEIARYGDRADIPEDEARAAWGEIVEIARHNPKFALVLGMPIGSMYVQKFNLPTFILHATGDSNLGKTEGTEVAMNTLGLAQKPHGPLYRTWNASTRAFGNLLKKLGVLPLYLDDTATTNMDEEAFTNTVFEMAQGHARAVADTEGGLREGSDDVWTSCVLSSGERGLVAMSDLSGLRRRVLEIRAPLIETWADGHNAAFETHDLAVKLSREAYGWPLWWLAEDPDPEAFNKYQDALGGYTTFSGASGPNIQINMDQKLAFVEIDNIVTCLAGFVVLGRLVGVNVLDDAIRHVEAIHAEFQDRYTEHAPNIEDRVLEMIRADKNRFLNSWPSATDTSPGYAERHGVTFTDDTIGILDKASLKKLTPRLDPDSYLPELKEAGMLVVPQSRSGFQSQRVVFTGSTMTKEWVYVIRLPEQREDLDPHGEGLGG